MFESGDPTAAEVVDLGREHDRLKVGSGGMISTSISESGEGRRSRSSRRRQLLFTPKATVLYPEVAILKTTVT